MARWITVSGDFPPTLNKEDDKTTLQPNESPECYGVDMTADGFLASGSIPAGTSRTPETNTFAGKSWEYYHNRSWYDTGNTLHYTAPYYNDYDVRQGVGKLSANDTIQQFMPAFGSDMWVCTAQGSHIIRNTIDQRGFYNMDEFRRELNAPSSTRALVLDGQPWVCNDSGVFAYDGRETRELTRNIRGNISPFANKPIKANYERKYVIGDSSFAIDASNGKLFDYSSTGFRFRSRDIAQANATYGPITLSSVMFIYELKTPADGGSLTYEVKVEDGDWEEEPEVVIEDQEEQRTSRKVDVECDNRTGRRFSLRITAIDANVKLRRIDALVDNLANNAYSE